jgi:hypothetical protein
MWTEMVVVELNVLLRHLPEGTDGHDLGIPVEI